VHKTDVVHKTRNRDAGTQTDEVAGAPSVGVDFVCQTDPEEPLQPVVVVWSTLPLELESLSEQWTRWYETQTVISNLIVYSRELEDPLHPEHEDRIRLRAQIAKRINQLLEVQAPLDMPIKDDVRRCWDASTWVDGPSDPADCPVSDGLVYHRATESEKQRREQWKSDARATNCTVPAFSPKEEWPLWRYDEGLGKHVRNKDPGLIREGPYWVPRAQWNRWSRDRKFGWVPMSPEIQDTSEWTRDPVRGWIRKAILEEEERSVSQSAKHARDEEDFGGPSQSYSKKRRLSTQHE
jgi:hypothetical protein